MNLKHLYNFINKKTIFFAILILAYNLYAKEMTWQDIVNEAKLNNPTIKKAEDSLKQVQLSYKVSKSNFFPQISASAGKTRSGTEVTNPIDNYIYTDNYTYGISGRLSVFKGFTDSTDLKIKNIDIQIETEKYKRTTSDVFYNLKRSYVNLLWSQEMVNLSKEIYGRRMKNYELIQQKYKAGREDKGSFLGVEADMFNAEYDYTQSKRNLEEASFQLLKEIGINNYDFINVKGDFQISISTENPSFDLLLDKIPEYLTANYNLEKSKLDIKTAKSIFYPDVSISGNTSKSGNEFPPDTASWSTSINLSLPLFSGGKNLYNLKIAKVNENTIEKSLQETTIKLHTTLKSAWNSFLSSIETVKVKEKYLIAYEEQSRIVTQKYLNGLASYYDWYNVENDFINSKKMLLNAKKEAVLLESIWKNKLGGGE